MTGRRGTGPLLTAYRRQVKAWPWPASARVFRSTLRELVDHADPDGRIRLWRTQMTAITGLDSMRTVDHHLSRLKALGWLEVESFVVGRGPDKRPAVYLLTTPDSAQPLAHEYDGTTAPDSAQPVARKEAGIVRNPQVSNEPRIVRKLVAHFNKETECSEDGAVDRTASGETTTTAAAPQRASHTSNRALTRTSATPTAPVTAACQPSTIPTATDPHTTPVDNGQRATAPETPTTGLRFTAAVERDHDADRQRPPLPVDTATFARPSATTTGRHAIETTTPAREHDTDSAGLPTICVRCGQQLVIVEPGRDTCARCQYRRAA